MLTWIAWASIGIAVACAAVIVVDEARHPQSMGVMNLVWPLTALYLSVIGVWWYFRVGRRMTRDAGMIKPGMSGPGHGGMSMSHMGGGGEGDRVTLPQSLLAASHCGAGCVVGDILSEFTVFYLGLTIAGSMMKASLVWDFVAAWTFGIAFQYFTIKPMRNLTVGEGIVAAVKADTLSIIAFQIGMYVWMAVVHFRLFPSPHLKPVSPVFWMMMQIAMVLGFLASAPVNRWLIEAGWKEKMG